MGSEFSYPMQTSLFQNHFEQNIWQFFSCILLLLTHPKTRFTGEKTAQGTHGTLVQFTSVQNVLPPDTYFNKANFKSLFHDIIFTESEQHRPLRSLNSLPSIIKEKMCTYLNSESVR